MAVSTISRTAVFDSPKKNRGLRMIAGASLVNLVNSSAGPQTVFHGAPTPGGFTYADLTSSNSIGMSRFVYTLSRQNLTRPRPYSFQASTKISNGTRCDPVG